MKGFRADSFQQRILGRSGPCFISRKRNRSVRLPFRWLLRTGLESQKEGRRKESGNRCRRKPDSPLLGGLPMRSTASFQESAPRQSQVLPFHRLLCRTKTQRSCSRSLVSSYPMPSGFLLVARRERGPSMRDLIASPFLVITTSLSGTTLPEALTASSAIL